MRPTFQSRTVIINIITALILVLILEALITIGLRYPRVLPAFTRPYFQGYYLSKDRKIIQMTPCAQYDPQLFYMLKEGSCTFKNREFEVVNQINREGLRDDASSLEKPDVVVFGDSFTLGWGIDQQKTFPQLLEVSLNKKVLNTGMSSFGTAREMLLSQRLDLSNTSKIIIQYHPNDYEENAEYIKNGFELKIRSKETYDSLREAINNRSAYFPFKHLAGLSKSFASQFIKKNNPVIGDTLEAQAFLKILQHSKINEATREIIVFRINKYGKNHEGFEDAIDHLLSTQEFSDLNIRTARVSTALGVSDYFILDDHINENGHAKIATQLAKFFEVEQAPVLVDEHHSN